MPKEPSRLLERRVRGQITDRKTGNDELTSLTVNLTEPRSRGNYSLKTLACHRVNLEGRLSGDKFTQWEKTDMIATGPAAPDISNSNQPAARSRSADSPWQVVFSKVPLSREP